MPRLPATGTLSRTGCAGQAAVVSGMGLLGKAGSGIWRPAGGAFDSGPCARGAWRQSHRTNVHRRSLRRFSVQGVVSRWVCQSAYFHESRRRARFAECLHGRDFALRAACEQAFARGVGELPALFGARAGDSAAARGAGTGKHCDAGLFGTTERARANCDAGCVSVSAWREL